MKRLTTILILLVLIFHQGYALTPSMEYSFRHYTNKQGLSHNSVFCSLQDTYGYLWFGTESGLNRFDGQKFTVYKNNPADSTSIPYNNIYSLFEDSKKRVWVCSLIGPTCYYDYDTNQFHKLILPKKFESYHFLYVREDKDHTLWLIGINKIIRYTEETKQITELKVNSVFNTSVCLTTSKDLVISDNYSIYTYVPQKGSFIKYQILNNNRQKEQNTITKIQDIPNSGFFVGTSKTGLLYFDPTTQTTTTIIKDIYVHDIQNVNTYEYWIASESGIFIYNIINKNITHIQKSIYNPYSLSDNAVYSLTLDNEGGVWIGTFFGGINYLPQKYLPFEQYISGKTSMTMGGNAIREICKDKNNHLWIGTEDNGFNCFDPATKEFTNFSANNTTNYFPARNIHGLLADDDDLWIGTFYNGLYLFDISSRKVKKKFTNQSTNNGLRSDFVLCLHKLNKDTILIGTNCGFSIYNKKTDQFSIWADSITSIIHQIYEDRQNRLWFATSQGFYLYQPSNNSIKHFCPDIADSKYSRKQDITSIFEDSNNNIWICTMQGIYKFINDKNEIFAQPYVELEGAIAFRIEEDHNKHLWISTADGLYSYNPFTKKKHLYTNKDGLFESQFNYSSSFKGIDGQIYFGTINGLVSFNPKRFKKDEFVPPIYITDVYAVNQKNKIKVIDNSIHLPYSNSSFTLSFVALSYTSPEAIKFAYKLDNEDKEWQQIDQNRDITFAKLAPGKYNFKIKSTNSTGQWQNNEFCLMIYVKPPFFATVYAYIFYLILLFGSIFLFYKYKKRKMIKKHLKEQSLFELEKEKELYEAKLHFFTVITHEIRTPLTLIKAPLEKIIKSKDGTAETRNYLNIIHNNTERLHNLTNQLMDYRKISKDEFDLTFLSTDITVWLETVIQSFKPAFEKEKKILSITYSKTNILADIDREAFAKIINNLLSNALKYSALKTSLVVNEADHLNNCFTITMTNDGLLIKEEEAKKIFNPFYRIKENEHKEGSGIGLSLALSLSRNHGGNLQFQQTEDGQNQFTLTLPIHQTAKAENPQEEKSAKVKLKETEADTETIKPTIPSILIVEDQPEMLDFIAFELNKQYSICKAQNGKEALEVIKENNIELIISDIMMPEMDGFELCNILKNDVNFSHIPIILLTAQLNSRYQLKGLNMGADAYMQKPFSIEILLAQIENLLKSRKLLSKSYQEKPLTPVESLAVNPMDNIFLQTLNKYIEEHLTQEKLNIELVAQEMNMSTSSLYRKVKNLSGVSPNDFIRIARLKKAVTLMHEGTNRISDIAYATGFTTPAYFSTCFQKQYGKSPSEYIKELRENA